MENPTETVEFKQASDAEAKSNLSIIKDVPSLPEKYIFISVTGDKLNYKVSANLSFIDKFNYLMFTLKHLTEQHELLLKENFAGIKENK